MHPAGLPPAMMPPRPPYAAQADPRLRMPGGHPGGPPGGPGMGPPVTVFVGNITEKAQDAMIRHLLNTNGPVNSWKRVQGATGKLQAFGFCEFGNPDAALRAIRILHDWDIADKKLVVKVDAKTKGVLEDFKRKKRKALLGEEKDAKADQDNVKESEYVDDTMKKEDDLTRDRIRSIIKEHSKDMNAYISSSEKRSNRGRSENDRGSKNDREPRGGGPPGSGDHEGEPRLTGPKESLDEVDLEDGKRDIIHREIDKFRETMKIREAEKEAEKQKRDKEKENSRPRDGRSDRSDREPRDREGSSAKDDRGEQRRSSNRDREKERSSETSSRRGGNDRGGSRRSRSKSFTPPAVESKRSSRSGSTKPERRISRSRSRSRERRSRSRRDSPIRERRDPKDVRRERELEEEDKDRKRAERKARDKESSYQERLRKWEGRESKMSRQYENDRMKEVRRKEDEEREGKKLREFLEDYDDDRDDEKYYKGSKLERRLTEREREAVKDAEDRAREKEEIEELRVQILNEGHADPNAELARRMAAMDGKKLVEVVDLEPESIQIIKEEAGVSPPMTMNDDHNLPEVIPMDADEESPPPPPPPPLADIAPPRKPSGSPSPTPVSFPVKEEEPALPVPAPKPLLQIQPNKKKIDVKDVFNQDDDDGLGMGKKKKLAPLPASALDHGTSGRKGSDQSATGNNDSKKSGKASSEDKRKHIKSLIDKIPTDKSALFEYEIDWDLVDNQLMEKRIRPWVNKKIAEYIGEPEPTLTDFICSKVLAGSTPKSVLDDVQMVLDEEAEVFVVKMWRLLIYEIENKKLKAATQQSAADK